MSASNARRWLLAASLLIVMLSMAGCSASTDDGNAAVEDVPSTIAPAPETTLPSTQAGPLDQSDLPAPEDLGEGWDFRIDPGSAEDGYSGSGAPAIARDPRDVLAAITPLGCKPRKLPTPAHALEVTYQRFETPGVGLLLEFDSNAEAQEFFDRHTAVLRDCVDSRQIELSVDVDDATHFISERTETVANSPTWTEGISIEERRVLLLAVALEDATDVVIGVLN